MVNYGSSKVIQIKKSLNTLKEKLNKARDLLLEGVIDAKDYAEIKYNYEVEVSIANEHISNYSNLKYSITEAEKIVMSAIDKLCSLPELFLRAEIIDKMKLLSLIFPERFTYENLQHRTVKVSTAFSLIYLINKELQGNKKGQISDFSDLPSKG